MLFRSDLVAYGGAGLGIAMAILSVLRFGLSPVAALFLILAVLLGYDAMRESLPDTMYVDENSESPFQPLTKHPLLTISEDTKEAEKTEFGETGETVVECSAAGIPLKKIRVIQEERPKVAVCGAPVGIYMETDGVMVIRTAEIRSSDGTVSRPSENILREGDYITKVNGQSIRSKQELIDAVKVSNGSPVCLSLLRDGETIEVQVAPQVKSISLDVGGTTTDIAFWENGLPLLARHGAKVAGYPTAVRSFHMRSVGIGGDSRIRRTETGFEVGPERIGPAMAVRGCEPTLSDAWQD